MTQTSASTQSTPPESNSARVNVVPKSMGYRFKRVLLGPPLVTERLRHERLSNGLALGVLAPDCISSATYGTEENAAGAVARVRFAGV